MLTTLKTHGVFDALRRHKKLGSGGLKRQAQQVGLAGSRLKRRC